MVLILLVVLVLLVIIHARLGANAKVVASCFARGNVGVFGKKRKGKDLLFQKVIHTRKQPYYANISYGGKLLEIINPSQLKYGKNTYKIFIKDEIEINERKQYEGIDDYISDGGNIFPSQYEKDLNERFPGLPLFVSLQGHAYNSNTHVNWNGSFTRLWLKIREQFDDVFKVVANIKMPWGIYVLVRYFEKPETAELNLLPYKNNRFIDTKQNSALRKQYYATNGLIRDMWICVYKWEIKYDTRAFEKRLFNDERRIYKGA